MMGLHAPAHPCPRAPAHQNRSRGLGGSATRYTTVGRRSFATLAILYRKKIGGAFLGAFLMAVLAVLKAFLAFLGACLAFLRLFSDLF